MYIIGFTTLIKLDCISTSTEIALQKMSPDVPHISVQQLDNRVIWEAISKELVGKLMENDASVTNVPHVSKTFSSHLDEPTTIIL